MTDKCKLRNVLLLLAALLSNGKGFTHVANSVPLLLLAALLGNGKGRFTRAAPCSATDYVAARSAFHELREELLFTLWTPTVQRSSIGRAVAAIEERVLRPMRNRLPASHRRAFLKAFCGRSFG